MIDLLSLIGTVLGDRSRAAERAQQRQQFNQNLAFQGAESERGRQFTAKQSDADRTARLNEFNTSQKLARDQFAEQIKQHALDYGLSQRQVDEQIRQFDAKLATDRDQFNRELEFRGSQSAADRALQESLQGGRLAASATEQERALALERERLAQSGSQFGQSLANNQSQFGQNFGLQQRELTNQENQQGISNLSTLARLVGEGATSIGQADILSLLAGKLGQSIPAGFLLKPTAAAAPRPNGLWENGKYNYISNVADVPGYPANFSTRYDYVQGRR